MVSGGLVGKAIRTPSKKGRTKMSNSNGGIGLVTGLTLIFVVLKLLDLIQWSWIWVLSPIWISWGIVVAILIIALILALIVALVEK